MKNILTLIFVLVFALCLSPTAKAQTQDCTVTLSATAHSFTPTGGTDTLIITAPDGCRYKALLEADSFLTITEGAEGAGSGTIKFLIAQNTTGKARQATITVGDKVFTLYQGTNRRKKLLLPPQGNK